MSNVDPSVVVIGMFDGVHKGHQALLVMAQKVAQQKKLKLVVVTFHPHPRALFNKDEATYMLATLEERRSYLQEYGVNDVEIIPFTAKYAQTTAEEFIEETLKSQFNAQVVVVGEDFCFGNMRRGNVDLLKEHFETISMPLVGDDESNYSSSRIRLALKEGRIVDAGDMLGRPFTVHTVLEEDDMCNLVGDISCYTPVKNAVYWAKIVYSENQEGHLPVAVKNAKVYIPPMNDIPDVPEGPVELAFVGEVNA